MAAALAACMAAWPGGGAAQSRSARSRHSVSLEARPPPAPSFGVYDASSMHRAPARGAAPTSASSGSTCTAAQCGPAGCPPERPPPFRARPPVGRSVWGCGSWGRERGRRRGKLKIHGPLLAAACQAQGLRTPRSWAFAANLATALLEQCTRRCGQLGRLPFRAMRGEASQHLPASASKCQQAGAAGSERSAVYSRQSILPACSCLDRHPRFPPRSAGQHAGAR